MPAGMMQPMPYNPNSGGNVDWNGLLGSLGTGAGLYAQGNAQNNSASLANQYTRATGTLNPFGASGPNGFSAGMNNGNVNLNYGAFNPAYGNLAGASGGAADTAGGLSAPPGLSNALNGAFGQATSGLGGFNPGAAGTAANNAFLGAGNAASRAGMPQQDMMQNYMQQLQQLQAPGIQHQTDQLQGTLFGNGQTGSSSGGYLAQQFGQGLASQNTQNALAASQLGLQGQQVAANTAGTLGGMGNSLLSSAFNNFGGAAGLPAGLQGQYLNNAGTGIGAAGQLTNQGLGLYNAGLQTSLGQNQASSRAGYLAANNANSPNQQSPFGQLAAGLFGSLSGQGGQQGQGGPLGGLINTGRQLYNGYNQLSSLFGGGSAPLTGMMPGGGGVGMLSDMFGGAGATGAGSVLAGGADLGSIGSAGAGGMFDFSSMLGGASNAGADLSAFGGFNAAGGAAADLGAGTAGVGGGSLGATGFGADMAGGEAGMGGSLGASGGAAAGGEAGAAATSGLTLSPGMAALPAAAMLAIAAHQPGVSFNQNWWDGLNKTLAAGPGSGNLTPGAAGAQSGIKQFTDYQGALAQLNTDYGNGQNGVNAMPGGEMAKLNALGITPKNMSYLPIAGAAGVALAKALGIPTTSTTSRQKM